MIADDGNTAIMVEVKPSPQKNKNDGFCLSFPISGAHFFLIKRKLVAMGQMLQNETNRSILFCLIHLLMNK